MSLATDFITAVERATGKQGRQAGRHTRLICPCHDDNDPSLDVAVADDGSPLVHCRACQAGLKDVCDAIGHTIGKYLPDPEPSEDNWTPHGPSIAVYDYVDADGKLLFQAVRAANKQFAQRQPDPDSRHGWKWSLAGVELVPYRLPQVLKAASDGGTVYVVEGEKDVHAIEAAGAVATCNPMGAGKWRDSYSRYLAGATVIIVADNDEHGIKHARAVAASLASTQNGATAPTIVIAKTGKDAYDHLAAGHTLAELEPLTAWEIPPDEEPRPDNGGTGWNRINLSADEYTIPPDPPGVLGLIYKGKRHVISGLPESTKTLVAYIALLEEIRGGGKAAIVDFEMGPHATRRMLDDLGFTDEQREQVWYVAPDTPPEDGYAAILEHGTTIVLIDAAAGAYDVSGLDDNARRDAEIFSRVWIRPLWEKGIATLLVDHITKDAKTRGKFVIGSERKVGGADVHLTCDAVVALSRGGRGVVKVIVHKDRPGFLHRPVATVFTLSSDLETHAVTWTQRAPTSSDVGGFRPTRLMERISQHLETLDEPTSQVRVLEAVLGNAEAKVTALTVLVNEGYATLEIGPRQAKLYAHVKPYREASETPRIPEYEENGDAPEAEGAADEQDEFPF